MKLIKTRYAFRKFADACWVEPPTNDFLFFLSSGEQFPFGQILILFFMNFLCVWLGEWRRGQIIILFCIDLGLNPGFLKRRQELFFFLKMSSSSIIMIHNIHTHIYSLIPRHVGFIFTEWNEMLSPSPICQIVNFLYSKHFGKFSLLILSKLSGFLVFIWENAQEKPSFS